MQAVATYLFQLVSDRVLGGGWVCGNRFSAVWIIGLLRQTVVVTPMDILPFLHAEHIGRRRRATRRTHAVPRSRFATACGEEVMLGDSSCRH